MKSFIAWVLGGSWKTSLFGGIAVLSGFITSDPDIVGALMPPNVAHYVFAWATAISAFLAFRHAQDARAATASSSLSGPKVSTIVALLIPALCLGLSGCDNSQVTESLPYIQLASAAGTSIGLSAAHATAADRADVNAGAGWMLALSAGSLPPTPTALQQGLAKYLTTPGALAVGASINALYAEWYLKLNANSDGQELLQIIHALALGAQQGSVATTAQASAALHKLPPECQVAVWRFVDQVKAETARSRQLSPPRAH